MRQGVFLHQNPWRAAFVLDEVQKLKLDLAEFGENTTGHPEADGLLLDWAPNAVLDS